MSKINVVIVGAVRTPIGAIGGGLSSMQAQPLATAAIKALLDVTGVDPALVGYTCMEDDIHLGKVCIIDIFQFPGYPYKMGIG